MPDQGEAREAAQKRSAGFPCVGAGWQGRLEHELTNTATLG